MSTAREITAKRSGVGAFSGLELWCVDLARSGPALENIEREEPRLSQDDRDYAAGFKAPGVANERLVTRIALRLLLERACGARWRGVPLKRHQHGKPYLPGAPVRFSVSHVAGLALFGIATHGTIGVDVERSRVVHMRESRRSRIEAAAGALGTEPGLPGSGDDRFLHAWVRLEALAKADGGGIGRLLTRLGIAGQGETAQEADWHERARAQLTAAGVAFLADLALGEGLFAAVAAGPVSEVPQVLWMPRDLKQLEGLVR